MGVKKANWNTKAKKRSEKDDNSLKSILRIFHHFFSNINEWIEETEDPRNVAYITYTQTDLIILGILKNLCSVESMRSMEENFNEESCIHNFKMITGHSELSEIPHYDTLNYYLEHLSPQALTDIRIKMTRSLIRNKSFDNNRLFGKYWRVILDGTGVSYFKERHCENCLRVKIKNEDGTTVIRYYHKVLEAKLVLADNIVISLDTEFIENENENVTKQDCETNAAKRLMKRLKLKYPHMKFCIQGDALYAAESIMEICNDYGWKYILTHKQNRQPTIDECYNDLDDRLDKVMVDGIGQEKGRGYYYNHLETLAEKTQVMNMIEYQYSSEKENGETENHRMMWITNINVTGDKLETLINAGRGRWKIENGFNVQKNTLYKIEHLNSRNSNAMKNHYLLTQISDIIMQLYLAWDNAHSKVKKQLKNMASWILESFRKVLLTTEDFAWIEKRTSIYLQ